MFQKQDTDRDHPARHLYRLTSGEHDAWDIGVPTDTVLVKGIRLDHKSQFRQMGYIHQRKPVERHACKQVRRRSERCAALGCPG